MEGEEEVEKAQKEEGLDEAMRKTTTLRTLSVRYEAALLGDALPFTSGRCKVSTRTAAHDPALPGPAASQGAL